VNITDHGCQVLVGVDEDRLVAAAKKRPVAPVAPVEPLGIEAVYVAHDSGEITSWGSHAQMVMISHEGIGKDFDVP
jgi:hypothetical protein